MKADSSASRPGWKARAVRTVLERAERGLLRRSAGGPAPSVWIIGPPRTGTTLLYQVLAEACGFGFLSNFAASFPTAPAAATRLQRALVRRPHRPDFASAFGRTAGGWGAGEAPAFWYRWFPREPDVYVGPGRIPPARLSELRAEIAALHRVWKAPLVFKNTYNTMRVAPILEAMPEAVFLVMRRGVADAAASILKAREAELGDRTKWWALAPRDVAAIAGLPCWEQVVEQVLRIYAQVEHDRKVFGEDRFLDVSYEALCRDPAAAVAAMAEALRRRGVPCPVPDGLPASFSGASGSIIDPEDRRRIDAYIARTCPNPKL